ncbi:unnamed protein product [Durusdinium trenchii]|uniref:Calmodulin n=1 Tax=Durusdinium trenchii TaxID=1381693 RepID=A0ABP0LIE2_9DINO
MGSACRKSLPAETGSDTTAGAEQAEQIPVVHPVEEKIVERPGPGLGSLVRDVGRWHAPVVILDVGKGLKGIKASFFKLFPRGKFMSVTEFFSSESLLGHCIVLIHGGGDHKNYLGEPEREKLVEHLRKGGSLLTISAGGTFCGCNQNCLSLLPIWAHERPHWQRGTGSVKLKLTAYGEHLLPDFKGLELESQYYNGPLLLPVAEEGWGASLELPLPIFPLLTYQTEMNECHAVRQTQCGHGQLKASRSLLGMPAVLGGELGLLGGTLRGLWAQRRGEALSVLADRGPRDVETKDLQESMLLLVQRLASWLSASPQLRALSAAGRDAGVEEAVAARPLYSEVHVAGTERDGGELLRFPQPSAYPALAEDQISASEVDEFSLPDCRLAIVDLGKGAVSPGDVIFLHGGMANEHAERLGVDGRRLIRQHLCSGGGVMGVCAGAHWLSCRDLPLWGHILPAVPHDNKDWRRGIGEVSIALTVEGQRLLGLKDSSMSLRYANGPLLVALHSETYQNYQPGRATEEEEAKLAGPGAVPLAVFSDCADSKITGWTSMKGHAAAWAWCTSQGGRVIALSPHPEYHQTAESRLPACTDADNSGSISKLELVAAMQNNPSVDEFLMPGVDSSRIMDDENLFEKIDGLFEGNSESSVHSGTVLGLWAWLIKRPLSDTPRAKKIVYLVRHAESMENERVHAYDRLRRDLARGDWPKVTDVASALQLLSFNLDTPLSRRGERQLQDMKEQLQTASFLQEASPELLVFSPLQRAKRTAEVLFGEEVPKEAMKSLVERTPYEAFCSEQFQERLLGFKDWLAKIPQNRVVVVAHCQFFAKLLGKGCGMERYLSNTEVKRCIFDPEIGVFEDVVSLFEPDEHSSGEEM